MTVLKLIVAAVRERIKNGKDLFSELCSRHQITPDDVNLLVEMFRSINRIDLVGKVRKYQQDNGKWICNE